MAGKRKGRRPRGDGAVFYSASKGCWVWRAVTGHKPAGGVAYTEGRARTQAAAVAAKKTAEAANRRPGADRATVGDHLEHWLNDVAKPNTRESTWDRYEVVVRVHLRPRIGGVPLRGLTVPQVKRLWASMARDGVKPGTVKKCSEVLASALEAAVAEGVIGTAPTRKAKKPKVTRPEVEVFADGEVRAFLKAAEGDRFEALYNLAAATGAREGELLALERDDFDPAAGTVKIVRTVHQRKSGFFLHPPKSQNGVRTLALPPFALSAVARHLAGRGPGPVFTTASGNYVGRSNFVRKNWRPLLAAAGVKYRKFHTCRHTLASRMLAAGVDVAEVARVLGDRIETVTRSYAHWMTDAKRDTAAKIQGFYGADPTVGSR